MSTHKKLENGFDHKLLQASSVGRQKEGLLKQVVVFINDSIYRIQNTRITLGLDQAVWCLSGCAGAVIEVQVSQDHVLELWKLTQTLLDIMTENVVTSRAGSSLLSGRIVIALHTHDKMKLTL